MTKLAVFIVMYYAVVLYMAGCTLYVTFAILLPWALRKITGGNTNPGTP
jgi:hypothetical protein